MKPLSCEREGIYVSHYIGAGYGSMPALAVQYDEDHKRCYSLWKLSWLERLRVLVGGKIWAAVDTLPVIHQPISLMVKGDPISHAIMWGKRK